jgi:hypothetical protein
MNKRGVGQCKNHNGITVANTSVLAQFRCGKYIVLYTLPPRVECSVLEIWDWDNRDLVFSMGVGDTKPITPENAEEKIKTYLLFS